MLVGRVRECTLFTLQPPILFSVVAEAYMPGRSLWHTLAVEIVLPLRQPPVRLAASDRYYS